jgi:hypothetical protein
VQAKSADELDSKVQEMLDAGWHLCGSSYIGGNMFFQCITNTPKEQEQGSGLTVDDLATLSLLRGMGRNRFY